MAEADVIEPLGPARDAGESTRVGRVRLELDQGHWLEEGRTYRVLYQDIAGRWHETMLGFSGSREFKVRYLGPIRWWWRRRRIPAPIRRRAHVVRTSETGS